jgi:hypothetical protein
VAFNADAAAHEAAMNADGGDDEPDADVWRKTLNNQPVWN